MYVATGIILVFALFEYFYLDAYLKVFSVTEYYVARGTLDALDPSLQWAHGLMLSGMRPPEQGRELLPFLGDHRVSSLFLEPIGLGQFWLPDRLLGHRQIEDGTAAAPLVDCRRDCTHHFVGYEVQRLRSSASAS